MLNSIRRAIRGARVERSTPRARPLPISRTVPVHRCSWRPGRRRSGWSSGSMPRWPGATRCPPHCRPSPLPSRVVPHTAVRTLTKMVCVMPLATRTSPPVSSGWACAVAARRCSSTRSTSRLRAGTVCGRGPTVIAMAVRSLSSSARFSSGARGCPMTIQSNCGSLSQPWTVESRKYSHYSQRCSS